MKGFSDYNATLFNEVRKNGKVTYEKTYLYGIDWQAEEGVKTLKTSNTAVDSKSDITLFVPYKATDKIYISPKKFNNLENHDGYYTLRAHDKIVKGIIDFDLTPSNYRELELKYDDVVTIATVVNCDIMNHFQIECA